MFSLRRSTQKAVVGSLQFTAAVMNSASTPEHTVSQDKDDADTFADLAKIRQPRDSVSFTETEQKILELYDQLSELRLERALLEAQTSTQACKDGAKVSLKLSLR